MKENCYIVEIYEWIWILLIFGFETIRYKRLFQTPTTQMFLLQQCGDERTFLICIWEGTLLVTWSWRMSFFGWLKLSFYLFFSKNKKRNFIKKCRWFIKFSWFWFINEIFTIWHPFPLVMSLFLSPSMFFRSPLFSSLDSITLLLMSE